MQFDDLALSGVDFGECFESIVECDEIGSSAAGNYESLIERLAMSPAAAFRESFPAGNANC